MRQQHRSIQVQTLLQHIVFIQKPLTAFMIFTPLLFPIDLVGMLSLYAISVNPFLPVVTVHARVPSNGICRGFTFKYGKFLLPPRSLMTLSIPNVPACKQFQRIFISIFNKYFMLCNTPNICYDKNDVVTHRNACNVTHGVY